MDGSSLVQISGNALALLFLVKELAEVVRDMRGGTPEMKIISRQIAEANKTNERLLSQLIEQNRLLSDQGRTRRTRRN